MCVCVCVHVCVCVSRVYLIQIVEHQRIPRQQPRTDYSDAPATQPQHMHKHLQAYAGTDSRTCRCACFASMTRCWVVKTFYMRVCLPHMRVCSLTQRSSRARALETEATATYVAKACSGGENRPPACYSACAHTAGCVLIHSLDTASQRTAQVMPATYVPFALLSQKLQGRKKSAPMLVFAELFF